MHFPWSSNWAAVDHTILQGNKFLSSSPQRLSRARRKCISVGRPGPYPDHLAVRFSELPLSDPRRLGSLTGLTLNALLPHDIPALPWEKQTRTDQNCLFPSAVQSPSPSAATGSINRTRQLLASCCSVAWPPRHSQRTVDTLYGSCSSIRSLPCSTFVALISDGGSQFHTRQHSTLPHIQEPDDRVTSCPVPLSRKLAEVHHP